MKRKSSRSLTQNKRPESQYITNRPLSTRQVAQHGRLTHGERLLQAT